MKASLLLRWNTPPEKHFIAYQYDFIEDGILEIENEKVNVFENGRLFTRNIAFQESN